jgi:hypothetical protein
MVEVEWLKTAHDRAPSLDGASMWILLLAFGIWHELILGGGGLGENGEHWMGRSVSGKFSCIDEHMGFMGSRKLSRFDNH